MYTKDLYTNEKVYFRLQKKKQKTNFFVTNNGKNRGIQQKLVLRFLNKSKEECREKAYKAQLAISNIHTYETYKVLGRIVEKIQRLIFAFNE